MDASLFLHAAERIGVRVVSRAEWQDGQCTWAVTVPDTRRTAPAAGDLYSGTAGIALFLSELFAATGAPGAARAAHGAMRHALDWGERAAPHEWGFHTGRTGVVYAAVRAAGALGEPEYLERAERMLSGMAGHERAGRGTDVMGGAMGAIPALLALAGTLPVQRVVPVAARLGEHLMRVAHREVHGWSWGAALPAHVRNLCGLAHGASGAGHAFVELFAATGDERFRYAAEQAFRYERQFFDPAANNWPDLRHPDVAELLHQGEDEFAKLLAAGHRPPRWRPAYMSAWCHGAPGIGLARLRALQVLGDTVYHDEASAAVEATRGALGPRSRRLGNYSLCHGLAGNAETLLLGAVVLGRPELRAEAEALGRDGWERYGAAGRPWPCGAPVEWDPGLMLGESGTGYFYLRLADPRTPSVLLPAGPSIAAPDSRSAGSAAELRRQDRDAFWGRTLRVVRRCPGPAWARIDEVHEPAELLRELQRALAGEPDGRLREYVADAMRPEQVRYELLSGITDRTELYLHELRRSALNEPDWRCEKFVLSPFRRVVRSAWDWDGWLAGSAHTPLESPPERADVFLVAYPAAGHVRLRAVNPLLGLVLAALEQPATIQEVAARVTAAIADAPERASAIAAQVDAQVRHTWAARLVDPWTGEQGEGPPPSRT